MGSNKNVHPFCDTCSKELSNEEITKNKEHENFEFPICDNCFNELVQKINYVIGK